MGNATSRDIVNGVDFHAHTFLSPCGIHSHLEMLEAARARGMAGLAITDHGPALGGKHPSPVYERLGQPLAGIRFLRGIEANVTDEDGGVDIPEWMIPMLDVALLGLHIRFERRAAATDWTEPLLNAIRRHPFVDIISHPLDPTFPLQLERLAETARERGVALEINNSKVRYRRVEVEAMRRFLAVCRDAQCLVAVSSDAHAVGEVGDDRAVRPLIEASGISSANIVNATPESAFRFVESRRRNRAALCRVPSPSSS
jgi:putative hydrolase